MIALRLACLFLLGISTLIGCRACGTCYDYSPPVSDCVCGTCGNGRAGSIISGGMPIVEGEVVYEESQPSATPAPAEPGEAGEPAADAK